MRNKIVIWVVALIFVFGGTSRAENVQLDLFGLGMPATFPLDSTPYGWQADFDLGATFSEISHVYIDWSGEITGGLAVYYPGQQPFPLDVGIKAYLGDNPGGRRAEVWGGAASYPSPQIFEQQNEFTISGTTTWSDLLDGTGNIWIGYTEFAFIFTGGGYVEHGSVTLNSATLVIDGTVVPEPGTLAILSFALPIFRIFSRKKI